MVTSGSYKEDSAYLGPVVYTGLSTDTKPESCGNGSAFIEMDTSTLYFFDAENGDWLAWGSSDQAAEGGADDET